MKIIDRYIIKEFLLPFFYCSFAFFLLYLVADLFEHMDEFLKAGIPWFKIFIYYIYLLPSIFVDTVPFSLVLSLIYELGAFARHHEITGMKASGIAPKRIAMPFILMGILLSLFFFVLNEWALPKTNIQLETMKKMYFEKGPNDTIKPHQDLTYGNVKDNYMFYIRELDLATNTAKDIQIQYFTPQGSLQKLIRAETGSWLDNEWLLLNGSILRYDENGEVKDDMEDFEKYISRIHESPLDIIREEKAAQQMNFFELRNSLQKRFGRKIPRNQRVELYSKLSKPWMCLLLVLVVVPFGLNIPRGGAFAVVGKVILITLAYYGIQFFAFATGKQGYIHPIMAAWLTNAIFGGLGALLFLRLR